MNSKKLSVTIILLVLVCVPSLLAQQTAQATMQVQVTVLEGYSISSTVPNPVVLSGKGGNLASTELTTVSINKSAGSTVLIDRQETIRIKDEKDHNLDLRLGYTELHREKDVLLKIYSKQRDADSGKKNYGKLSASSLKVGVVYL